MSRRMFHRVLTKGDELSPAVMARFVQTIRRDALMPQVVRLLIESLISPRISVPALCCGASNQTSVPRDFGFGSGIWELALASYRKSSPTIPETMGTSRRKCQQKMQNKGDDHGICRKNHGNGNRCAPEKGSKRADST